MIWGVNVEIAAAIGQSGMHCRNEFKKLAEEELHHAQRGFSIQTLGCTWFCRAQRLSFVMCAYRRITRTHLASRTLDLKTLASTAADLLSATSREGGCQVMCT